MYMGNLSNKIVISTQKMKFLESGTFHRPMPLNESKITNGEFCMGQKNRGTPVLKVMCPSSAPDPDHKRMESSLTRSTPPAAPAQNQSQEKRYAPLLFLQPPRSRMLTVTTVQPQPPPSLTSVLSFTS
ncbi:unnamed protein product [Caretta caretta]